MTETRETANPFQKATKTQSRLRLALEGPPGSGKTYTALAVASALGERVALLDTEHGSASKYAHRWEFDTLALTSFHPERYIEAIEAAEAAGYDVLIIDSLSHAWAGTDGALELVDRATARSSSKNSYFAWADVTPLQHRLINTILGADLHVIATMRTKVEYVLETNNGKTAPRKVGLAPIQREGVEYEFDVVGDIDLEHRLVISKTRCEALEGEVIDKPGAELADTLKAWLTEGAPAPPRPPTPPPTAPQGAENGQKATSARPRPENRTQAARRASAPKQPAEPAAPPWADELKAKLAAVEGLDLDYVAMAIGVAKATSIEIQKWLDANPEYVNPLDALVALAVEKMPPEMREKAAAKTATGGEPGARKPADPGPAQDDAPPAAEENAHA